MKEWISVKDRLPCVIGDYLICFKEKDYKMIGWAFYNSKREWINISLQSRYKNVTHWMPLPDPPEDI